MNHHLKLSLRIDMLNNTADQETPMILILLVL